MQCNGGAELLHLLLSALRALNALNMVWRLRHVGTKAWSQLALYAWMQVPLLHCLFCCVATGIPVCSSMPFVSALLSGIKHPYACRVGCLVPLSVSSRPRKAMCHLTGTELSAVLMWVGASLQFTAQIINFHCMYTSWLHCDIAMYVSIIYASILLLSRCTTMHAPVPAMFCVSGSLSVAQYHVCLAAQVELHVMTLRKIGK